MKPTGAQTELASGLANSDDLVSDGAYLYTVSWPNKLVRIAKDGSRPAETLIDDLGSPSNVAVTADAIYVTSRDQKKIVRIRK